MQACRCWSIHAWCMCVQELLVQALIGRSITLEQGYEALDGDKDGKVSLQDIKTAVTNMEMSIDASSVEALFEHLDPDKLGYISRDSWSDKLAAMWQQQVLHPTVSGHL
jgi:hypothetical protein